MKTLKNFRAVLLFQLTVYLLLFLFLIREDWISFASLAGLVVFIVFFKRGWGLDILFDSFDENPVLTTVSLVGLVLLFPIILTLLGEAYWIRVAYIAGIYIMLALGLNIVVGFAGLLDLGYIAFYAIGAYLAAIVASGFCRIPGLTALAGQGWSYWIIIPLAMILAGLFGVLLGAPTLKLRGDYLAIVTMGFGEIIRIVLNNWDTVTNGPKGIPALPRLSLFGFEFNRGWYLGDTWFSANVNYFFLVMFLVFVVGFVSYRVSHSRIGRAWIAIREDELAARATGINTTALKLLAFASGASFAGVGGVIFAATQGFIDPTSFIFIESAIVLSMVVLGGMGSIPGVILGAILLQVIPEKLHEFQQYRMALFGLCMAVMMVLRPEGLIPSRRKKLELHHSDRYGEEDE